MNEIKSVKVLIWDEISMSSRRILNIVNLLHQKIHNNAMPFGGIQVILGGDFYQLKPIPDVIDSGDPSYKSVIFDKVFPHRIALTRIMRQGETEVQLKDALDRLRLGECGDETEAYLRGLSRSCTRAEGIPPPVHIYFRKLPVSIHNSHMLMQLSGQVLKFHSVDTGRKELLKDTIDEVLMLKPGCKIMLLYNVNRDLKNGTFGTFINIGDSDDIQVEFPNVGIVNLQRKTWYKFDNAGCVVASRTQYPLSLSYAITVHKAQSTTLDNVVVHCSQEFDSGQTYVAISRVKTEENLQVIGFQKRYLLAPPQEIYQISTTQDGNPVETFKCCTKVELDQENYKLDYYDHHAASAGLVDDEQSPAFDIDVVTDHDQMAKQCFEGTEDNVIDINGENLLRARYEVGTALPCEFSIKTFLDALKDDSSTDELSQAIKGAASYAIENLQAFESLTKVLWCTVAHLFDDYVEKTHLSSANFTKTTAKLHELFMTNEYRSDITTAFHIQKWSDITCGQRCLGVQLLFHIYQTYVAEIRKSVRSQEQEQITFQVSNMGAAGRGKVRYIGGWAIRKVLEKSRKYAYDNKQSQSKAVAERVSKEMKKVFLLQNNVILPYQVVRETTSNPETLHVTESRQFREHGLLNISDEAYDFFMQLEQQRVDHINSTRLSQEGCDLIQESIESVTNDKVLQEMFLNLFRSDDIGEEVSWAHD